MYLQTTLSKVWDYWSLSSAVNKEHIICTSQKSIVFKRQLALEISPKVSAELTIKKREQSTCMKPHLIGEP